MGALNVCSCGHVAEPGFTFTLLPDGPEVCPECWVKGPPPLPPAPPPPPLPGPEPARASAVDDFGDLLEEP